MKKILANFNYSHPQLNSKDTNVLETLNVEISGSSMKTQVHTIIYEIWCSIFTGKWMSFEKKYTCEVYSLSPNSIMTQHQPQELVKI